MAPRDVDALRARLAAVIRASRALSAQLEDLHAYAFDRRAGGEAKVAGGDTDDDPLGAGNPRARMLWERLETKIREADLLLVGLSQATANLLSAGPSAEATRGSLIRKAELKSAVRRQRRREADGEYTPRRMIEQPPYPGA